MRFTRTILVAAICFAPAIAATQPQVSLEDIAAKQTERMTTDLGLTQEQTEAIELLNLQHLQKLQDTVASGRDGDDRKETAKAFRTASQEYNAEVQALLNGSQRQIYQSKRAEWTSHALTQMMKSQLNLTADQESQVGQVNLSFVSQLQDMQGETQGAGRRGKFKAARHAKSLFKGREDQLKRILTVDQWNQYQTAKQQRKGKRP